MGGGGRGGGAARPGMGAQELGGFVDERMRAEGVFIAKEWRWQGGGAVRGWWWRPASGAASLNGVRPRSRVAERRTGGEAGAW